MALRDKALEVKSSRAVDRSKIGAVIEAHPDRADEIRDLLLGEPYIEHTVVADTLTAEFDPEVPIRHTDVTYWRRVNR